jgi:hypothetical protein
MEVELNEKQRKMVKKYATLKKPEATNKRGKEWNEYSSEVMALKEEFEKEALNLIEKKINEVVNGRIDIDSIEFFRRWGNLCAVIKIGKEKVEISAYCSLKGNINIGGYSRETEKEFLDELLNKLEEEKGKSVMKVKEQEMVERFCKEAQTANQYQYTGCNQQLTHNFKVEGRSGKIAFVSDLRFETEDVEKAVRFYKEIRTLIAEIGVEIENG